MLNVFPSPRRSQSGLSWVKKTWPQQDFNHPRILGLLAWCYIMGFCHDIGTILLTTGCYVLAISPPGYPSGVDATKNGTRCPTELLDTAISKKTTVVASLPWALEAFMKM